MSKLIQKPLKNVNDSNSGNLSIESLNVTNLVLDGTVSGGIFENVTLINSQLINTIISQDNPQPGYFSYLQVDGNVRFNSIFNNSFVTYDYQTGDFTLNGTHGSFTVEGCSFLGNLEICQNFIKAVNNNGDISFYPNGFGGLYLYGPVNINTTFGNYNVNVSSGNISMNASTGLFLSSSKGSILSSTFSQNYNTLNGDISLNTDLLLNNTISSIISTTGTQYIITTLLPSNLTNGNIISITDANLNTHYNLSVSSIIGTNSFIVNTASVINDTNGNMFLYKQPSNSIYLNSDSLYVNSNNAYFYDPNLVISNITNSSLINSIDRGIKFTSSLSNGNVNYSWFGYKNDTASFTYLVNVSESNNIITGNVGNAKFNIISGSSLVGSNISSSSIYGNDLYMNCGTIHDVSTIQGCNDDLTIIANNAINLSGGMVNIPVNNYLYFGDTQYNNSIYSDNTNLFINGYQSINMDSDNVTIVGNLSVLGNLFGSSAQLELNKYILPIGTTQYLPIVSIQNSGYSLLDSNGNVSIVVTLQHYFTVGDSITIQNSDSDPVIDGTYTVKKINSPYSFNISASNIITNGVSGQVASILTRQQGKDVGIEVDYWSSTGNIGLTSGSAGYKTGFFGMDLSTERFVFLSNAVNNSDVMNNGTFGDVQIGKLTSGSILVSNGSVVVDNFVSTSNLYTKNLSSSNILSSNDSTISNLQISGFLNYSLERIILTQGSVTCPNSTSVITFLDCTTQSIMSSSTMPILNINDGREKKIICTQMASGSSHLLQFPPNSIIYPNPFGDVLSHTFTFKYSSERLELVYDLEQDAWLVLNCSVSSC